MKLILRFFGVVFFTAGLYLILKTFQFWAQTREISWETIIFSLLSLNAGVGLILLFESGRKVTRILLGVLITIFGFSAILASSLEPPQNFLRFFDEEIHLPGILIILVISFISFFILSTKSAQKVTKNSQRHGLLTGWTLSFFLPGLGYAFSRNLYWGLLRFYLFMILVDGFTIKGFGMGEIMIQIIRYIFIGSIWIILAYEDLRTVNRAYNIQPDVQKSQTEQAILS